MAYFLSTIQKTAFCKTGMFSNSYESILIHYEGKLEDNTKTIFRNQITNQAFIGFVTNIKISGGTVTYKSIIEEEIDFKSISFLGIKNWAGWYLIDDIDYNKILNEHDEKKKKITLKSPDGKPTISESANNNLLPVFFNDLVNTTNPDTFEDLTYSFLKLTGINESIQIDRKDAAGRGDGFFKISTLCVIYDCTLRNPFVDFKKAQLNNYCNDLASGHFEYKKQSFTTAKLNCQVWVITKDKTQQLFEKDNVKVKEVSIDSIKDIYLKRIQANLNEHKLASELSIL